MSLFKESGNDRFKRESEEMWDKISSEKTTKETAFSKESTTTTSSASEQKRSYEERTSSNSNSSNRSGLLTQSSRLLNGGPGLVEQTQEIIGREGSREGKIQRANMSNSQNQENIEEPFVAEVALPRCTPGSPSKPTLAPAVRGSPNCSH